MQCGRQTQHVKYCVCCFVLFFHSSLQNSRIEKLYQSDLFLPQFEPYRSSNYICKSLYVLFKLVIGYCAISANILAARRSSAEAQALTVVGGCLGQHVPLQWRGRQAGALHGGCVHGHGGTGELRAQVQGDSLPRLSEMFFTPRDFFIHLFSIDFAGIGRLLTWAVVLYNIVFLLCHPKPSMKPQCKNCKWKVLQDISH